MRGVLILLLAAAAAFAWRSAAHAAQDLALRPVLLAAARGAPLPDADAAAILEGAAAGPSRPDLLLLLGETRDRLGDREGAAALYRSAARAFPASGLGQFRLATALLREGREAEARGHVRQAVRCAGNHPALLERLGDFHREAWDRAGDPSALAQCLGEYRAAAERNPSLLPSILARLDSLLPEPGSLAEAVPADPAARAVLALHLEARGRDAAALAVLEDLPLPADASRSATLRRARARALLRTGRPEEAWDALRSLLRTAPDPESLVPALESDLAALPVAERVEFWKVASRPRARLALARALRDAGDHPASMAVVDDVLRTLRARGGPFLDPATRRSLLLCSELRRQDWVRRGLPLQAAAEALEAARLDPTPGHWAAAARLFSGGGDARQARAAYGRAVELAGPGDEALLRSLREAMAGDARGAGGGR